ncbi:MAG TPA: IclR family transcriptional regulator [Microbacteriaceae bacterium]|nr:IclR family transcriptional regulator [Microbacteriaceae bacterium]
MPQSTADQLLSSGSQTLARGLRVLEILADAPGPLSVNELASQLGVHRSNAYRLLRTLEEHRFVVRRKDGLIRIGPKLTVLARGVAPGLAEAANGPIAELANSLGMTVFVAILDDDEVITIASAEPANANVSISRKPGTKHSVLIGAPGHTLEAELSPKERETILGSRIYSAGAELARKKGYAESFNEVIDGVCSISVPLSVAGEALAAVALVHFSRPKNPEELADELLLTAAKISQNYH